MQSKKEKKKLVDFRKRKLLFVDLETTGIDPDVHEIVEVGCLVVDGETLEICSKYYAKVKPLHPENGSTEAIKISGYKSSEWKDAIPLKNVLEEIVKLAPNAMLAGWKVDFDWWFLEHALKKNNIKFEFDYHLVDVMALAYVYFRRRKNPKHLGLRTAARHFKVHVPEKHGAMSDIEGTYNVFRKLLSRLEK